MRASEMGLDQREVVNNVITALTSNGMIAPSFWIDPKTGNDYMLTVQYPERQVATLSDLRAIPLRGPGDPTPTRLDMISAVGGGAAHGSVVAEGAGLAGGDGLGVGEDLRESVDPAHGLAVVGVRGDLGGVFLNRWRYRGHAR